MVDRPPPVIYRNIVILLAVLEDNCVVHWMPTTNAQANDPANRDTIRERLMAGLLRRAQADGMPIDPSTVAVFRSKRDWYHSDNPPAWAPESPDWMPWEATAP